MGTHSQLPSTASAPTRIGGISDAAPRSRVHTMNLSATTAIITMVRSAEFPAAWSSLGTVEGQLNANTHQFLLLNDFRDENLEHELRERQFTHLLAPGENLGVARGRNQLLDAALAWGAEFIVSLDDDLIVPADFVIRVTSWLRERLATGQKIGIVIPTVLDFAPVAERIWDSAWIDTVKAGRLRDADPTDAIRRRISGAWPADLPPDLIYHAGIRDWRRHYIDSYQGMARTVHDLYLNSRGRQHQIDETTELRLDPSVRRAAVDGQALRFLSTRPRAGHVPSRRHWSKPLEGSMKRSRHLDTKTATSPSERVRPALTITWCRRSFCCTT